MQELNPEIFSSGKWQILKEVAHAPISPTDIASKNSTSLSNITQQLKLFEAYELVKKEKSKEKAGGKPKLIYSLNNEFVYAIMLKNGSAEKRYFGIDGLSKTFFNMLFMLNADDVYFLLKFHMLHEDLVKKCKAIGFLRTGKDSIELFLVTDNVDEIRSKMSNIFIQDSYGKTKKIINWSHNEFEINDGLNRKDKYFMDMLKNSQILHDPTDVLKKFKIKRESL